MNLVVLFCALSFLERFIFPPHIESEAAVTTAVIVYSVVVKLIIYPWQVVGVIRTCDFCIKSNTNKAWATAALGTIILSLGVTLVSILNTYQSLLIFKQDLIPKPSNQPGYSLELMKHKTLLLLHGPMEIGITQQVSRIIKQNSTIAGIILDSEGGQVYEGRGLARLILEHKLDTYVRNECLSACTTVFVAGKRRILSMNARLGFHQYKTFSGFPPIDIKKEQLKDRKIFNVQGVSATFLDNIFLRPPDSMWWPKIDELVDAGVVHQVGYSPGASEE